MEGWSMLEPGEFNQKFVHAHSLSRLDCRSRIGWQEGGGRVEESWAERKLRESHATMDDWWVATAKYVHAVGALAGQLGCLRH